MHNHSLATALVFLLAPASAAPLCGQRLGPVLLGFSPPFPRARADSVARPPTYWREGAVIGGTSTGLLLALVANGFCNDSDSNTARRGCLLPTVEAFLIGAIPGVVIGAIIGSGFHKKPRGDQPP